MIPICSTLSSRSSVRQPMPVHVLVAAAMLLWPALAIHTGMLGNALRHPQAGEGAVSVDDFVRRFARLVERGELVDVAAPWPEVAEP